MSWWSYVQRVTGDAQQKEIAEHSGVDQSTVSRWKNTGVAGKPERVRDFARAYGRPVLEAYIAAGFLTPEEAKARPTIAPALDELSDEELLEELLRRRAAEHAKQDTHHGSQQDHALAARRGRKERTPADALNHAGEESQETPE